MTAASGEMTAPAPLRVGIAAQIAPGEEGGIDQFLMALMGGLTAIPRDADHYQIVALESGAETLRQWTGESATVVARRSAPVGLVELTKRALGPVRRPAGRVLRSASGLLGRPIRTFQPDLASSDGFFERLGLDVLHVPYIAHYEKTPLPTVLTLHDLQHRHFPEFFGADQLAWRERVYPEAIQHASLVVTDCQWGRDDIVRQYGADPAKVKVVLLASPIGSYRQPTTDECSSLRRRLELPESFALYPALTYGHKNHVRLLEAIAQLRDKHGLLVHTVCPGQRKLHWPVIRRRLEELGLVHQVRFPGFLPAHELRALYRMARLVVFPSLFEGAGLPTLEALAEGVPLVCSDIPAVREYVGLAATFFDPRSVDEMALALAELWQDEDRRAELRARGKARSAQFSPARMAAEYRDLYRAAASGSTCDRPLMRAEAVVGGER